MRWQRRLLQRSLAVSLYLDSVPVCQEGQKTMLVCAEDGRAMLCQTFQHFPMRMMKLIHVAVGDEGEPRLQLIEKRFGGGSPTTVVTDLEQSDRPKFAAGEHVVFDGAFCVTGEKHAARTIGEFDDE